VGSEEVDIDEERQRWISDVHARLDRLSHYDLLGVRRDADPKEIKRAYFALAAKVHPDRFFKKRLGRFKPKMEAIFTRVTTAFDTLRDAGARARYDAALGDAPAEKAPRAPVDPKVAEERRKAMEALKARFEASRGEAQKHLDAGARARSAGDLVTALQCYERAAAVAPGDAAVAKAVAELRAAANERLVDSHAKKAALEERFGRWAAAAESWERVVQARPDDQAARARLAHALARSR
jgi:curved DNA-binding protein CbpA